MSDQGESYLAQGCTQCGIWQGEVRVRPAFIITERYGHRYWTCPMCQGSYGEVTPQSPASPLPEATEPVGYASQPISWSPRQSEQTLKLTREPQPSYGFVSPVYASPSPVAQAPAQAGEVARLLTDAKAALQLINKRDDHYWRKVDRSLDAALARLATQPLAAPGQQEAEAVRFGMTFSEARRIILEMDAEAARGMAISLLIQLNLADKALATPPAQPVLAPVVREPLSIEQILRIADEADLARDYNGDGDVQSTRREDADITEDVVHFARAIERHFGIQATTGEQSHG